ncbi:hypothetical protein COOONC_17941 [Cooperia oncophora]
MVKQSSFLSPDFESIQELENETWYHGALPLEDVVCLIPERGDFLLRALEAEGGRGPMPCLTVRVENHIKDFPYSRSSTTKHPILHHRWREQSTQRYCCCTVSIAPLSEWSYHGP